MSDLFKTYRAPSPYGLIIVKATNAKDALEQMNSKFYYKPPEGELFVQIGDNWEKVKL